MIRSFSLSLVLLAAACGGDDLVLPAESAPATITIVEGDGQSGRVGEQLSEPIVARVTDTRDRPVEGATVAFTFDGGPGTALAPETATTDADGRASVRLQLGTQVGEGQGVARVAESRDPILQAGFTATAVSGTANGIRAVSGDGQTGQVGAKLPERLVVQVTDASGNAKSGITVTWSVTGGGRVSATTTKTGSDGRASVERTLGSTAGVQTTRANATGLAGSPVTFVHTATPAAPGRVVVVAGSGQSAAVATRLPQDLVAEVRDAGGNPISGVMVTWVVTTGGGTVEPSTSTSGSNGRASTRWTLGYAPGTNRVEARVSGATPAVFTATAMTGASASLAIVVQPSGTAAVGVPFAQQPAVQLRDAAGNDVKRGGVSVTAAIASGDGAIAGTTTRTTDANGRAVFTNLRITAATGPHTLIFAASGHTSVVSEAVEVHKASTTTTLVSDTPDPSVPGAAITVNFAVTSEGGTPSGSVTVTVSGGSESCSANVAAGSCSLVLDGEGSRTLAASYGGDALFEGSSDTEEHTVRSRTGTPTIISGNDQTGSVSTTLPQDLVVEVRDAGGAPVSGVPVTWVVTAGGGSVNSTTTTSGSDGRASVRWTLGAAPGTNQVEARVSGASAAVFTATATAGASAALAVRTQPSGSATVGVPFAQQPVIQLRDAGGNDVSRSGVAVTVAVASGDGTIAGTTTRTTDSDGRAIFTNLRIAGATGPHTLIFAASGHTSATSDVINVGKASTTTTIVSDDPDPSGAGGAVTVSFTVTSDGGTPSGSVTISASTGESCSASVAAGSCSLVPDGEGSRTLTASYGGDALFEGSSDTEEHTVQTANAAPTAVSDAYTTSEGQEKTLVVPAPGVLANDVDPDGDPLRVEKVSDPLHGVASLSSDGSFTYNPAPDYWGDDAFTYRVTDGHAFGSATVAITVLPVNDAPVFRLLGGDQAVAADAGRQEVAGFAEALSPGAANEQGQRLDFLVDVGPEDAALFSQLPAITPDGTLTYTPSGALGTAVVAVRLHDDGGTANGGDDTSAAQTFTIALTDGQGRGHGHEHGG